MRFFPLLPLLITAATALDFTSWHPPVDGDVRSPCPALNSLANHDIIPHNGKNIKPHTLSPILHQAFNISPAISSLLAYGALLTTSNPLADVFDLDDLDAHNVIEHDGSLSRADYHLADGNDHTFRPEIFKTVLEFFKGPNVTIPEAAAARHHRIETERERDPAFVYGPKQMLMSYSESALYYLAMKDPKTGATPVEFFRVFFEEERLPYIEGWRPPQKELTQLEITSTVLKIAKATPGKGFEGEDIPRMQHAVQGEEFVGHLGGGLALQKTIYNHEFLGHLGKELAQHWRHWEQALF